MNLTKSQLKQMVEEVLTAELNSKARRAKISPRKKTPDLKQMIQEEMERLLFEQTRKRRKFSPPKGPYKDPTKQGTAEKFKRIIQKKKAAKTKLKPAAVKPKRKRKTTKWTTAKKTSKKDQETFGSPEAKKRSLALRAKDEKARWGKHTKKGGHAARYKQEKAEADKLKAQRAAYGEDELTTMKKRYKQLPWVMRFVVDRAKKGDPKAIASLKKWDTHAPIDPTGKSALPGRNVPILGKVLDLVSPEYRSEMPGNFLKDIEREKEIMKHRKTKPTHPLPAYLRTPVSKPKTQKLKTQKPFTPKGFKQSGASKAMDPSKFGAPEFDESELKKNINKTIAQNKKPKRKISTKSTVSKKDAWVEE